MSEPPSDFERIAEAARVAEVEKNLSKPATPLQRVLLALFLGSVGPLMLRLGRFTDGVSGPWWLFVLTGLACAALGYFVVPWAAQRRRRGGY